MKKETIKNLILLLIFVAGVFFAAWAMPLWVTLGIIILLLIGILVSVAGIGINTKLHSHEQDR